MKKTYLFILFTVFIIITCITFSKVIATTSNGLYASILYSSELAGLAIEKAFAIINAEDTYTSLGYSTTTRENPPEIFLFSNLASADILLELGHGDTQSFRFANMGVKVGEPAERYGKPHISIDSFDWTQRKLVILASCNSSGNHSTSYNTIAGQIALEGSDVVIGWYEQISAFDSPNWLNSFHNKISNGYNPLEAASYACEQSYADNGIKCTSVFYDDLTSLRTNRSNNIQTENYKDFTINNVEQSIKEIDPTIDFNNYQKSNLNELVFINNQTKEQQKIQFLDYNLKIGKFILNSGYTIVIENDKIQKVIDNIADIDYEKISEKLMNSNIELQCQKILNTKKNIKDIKYYYLVESNQPCIEITYCDSQEKETFNLL